jgi:hypothetical protein
MADRVVPLDFGCQPSPSGSAELILQDDESCYVLFMAIATQLSEEGFLEQRGVAVAQCVNFMASRHGYPNDEGRDEHRLWSAGLSDSIGIAEVIDSSWLAELESQLDRSTRRLWTVEALRAREPLGLRHYILQFKESTLEILANDLRISLHQEPYAVVAQATLRRMLAR